MALSKHVDVESITFELRKQAQELSGKAASRPGIHSLAFASRFTDKDIPKYEMPEKSTPANAVYQLIKDELELEGRPIQNMASFVSTWMEPEAVKLMTENMSKNFADKQQYSQTNAIQDRCINMLSRLFNVPDGCNPVGTSTIGSSEAIMLCCLAAKFNWKKKMKELGKSTEKPNIVFGSNAHVVVKKFACYFDVEAKIVPIHKGTHYMMEAREAASHVDENTICVVSIMGSTFTGHYEKVEALNCELDKLQAEKGLDVPIHVDAASGGFVAPFLSPDLPWDFRLSRVRSINVSGHKYGLVYPGIGWAVWRDEKYLPEEIIFHLDYLGGNEPTFNLNFSRSSVGVLGQYYNLIRLGREGYADVMRSCLASARFLSLLLERSGYFELLSEIHKGNDGLPLVCLRLKAPSDGVKLNFDEYDIMHTVRQKGWIVPAYKLPPELEDTTIIRIVVREIHTASTLEKLGKDLVRTYEILLEAHGQLAELKKAAHQVKAGRRLSLVPNLEGKRDEEKDKEKDKVKKKGKPSLVRRATFSSVC